MDYENFFKDMFESNSDFGRIVLLIILTQNDKNLLREIGFGEHDINRLNLELKNLITEQHEEYLDYVKNEEESVIEKVLNK